MYPLAPGLRMNKTLCVTVGTAALILATTRSGLAAVTTIDFESFPNQPFVLGPLDIQYASLGVIFDYQPPGDVPDIFSPAGAPPIQPHSGMHFATGPDFGVEFGDSDFRIKFSSPQSLVQLWGGTTCVGATGTLVAFDSGGNPVGAVDSRPFVAAGSASTSFSVTTGTTPAIREISFRAFKTLTPCVEAIDDLHIEGDPPPAPGGPPTIILQQPLAQNDDYGLKSLQAVGSVQGTDLFSLEVVLKGLNAPAGQPLPTELFAVNVVHQTGTLPFDVLLRQIGKLTIGNHRVTATVKDFAGRSAQATVDFSYFPLPPDPNLGPFKFAVPSDNCQMLFYQNSALAYFSGNNSTPIAVPTVIAEKWRTVNSPVLGPLRTLGCPVSGPDGSVANWTAQDFQRGRIYAPSSGNVVYVPGILTGAIKEVAHCTTAAPCAARLAAEFLHVGWPVSDPDWSLVAEDPVWVFQRFAQNNLGPAYHNTLEIRGRTPTLFVERIGGDIDETVAAKADPNQVLPPQPVVDNHTPTWPWLPFPCVKAPTDSWPTVCDLSTMLHPSHETPGFAGGPACGAQPGCGSSISCSDSFCPTYVSTGWAWNDVGTGANYTDAAYNGIIRALDQVGPSPGSHLANSDNPLVHDNCNFSFNQETITEAAAVVILPVSCTLGWIAWAFTWGETNPCAETWAAASSGAFCRSDWNLHTRPMPGAQNWNFLSEANSTNNPRKDFEIEFEVKWAKDEGYFTSFNPRPGDLVFVHGRHIIDCGHCPYNAEIHPQDTMVVSRSFAIQPIGAPEEFRVSEAYLWVNSFFPNIINVPVVVYAPPRPSMHSKLIASYEEPGYHASFNMRPMLQPTLVPGGMKIVFSTGRSEFAPQEPDSVSGQWHYPNDVFSPRYVDYWRLAWNLW